MISRVTGEPVIAERDWLRLRAMVEGRRRGRPASQRYLGSGVLRCGACGKKLGGQVVNRHAVGGRKGGTSWRYVCNVQRGGCDGQIKNGRSLRPGQEPSADRLRDRLHR